MLPFRNGKALWNPGKYDRICCEYFVGNVPSSLPSHPGYVPSIFPDVYKKKNNSKIVKER